MKRLFKKMLASLLVAAMVLTAAPLSGFVGLKLNLDWLNFDWLDFNTKSSALDSSGSCGENVTYIFDRRTGLLTISGTGKMENYSRSSSPFYNDNSIKSVVITKGVTSIGDYAFYYCTGLTSVTIPNSVTSIGNYAFRDCGAGLTSITIPNSVTSIGNYAFEYCESLTSITIPNSVTSIGNYAFRDCTGLTSITIPNSVTSISDGAFYYCTGLTSITIPNSVTSISDDAFRDCTGLTSVTIPNSVTSIGSRAFYNCTGLTSVTIPNSVTSIGSDAFCYSTGLTNITIPNSVTSIGSSAFYYCTGLTSITVDKDNKNYCNDEYGVLYNKSKTQLIQYPVGNRRKTFNIPNSVTSIGEYAFSYCTGLTNITIPSRVTSIGNWAFCGCTGLTNITIPNSVTSIGNWAFCGCTGLTSITIPNSVTSISDGAFYYCTGLTSITIPNSVTSIGDSAFYYCTSLTNITIPSSVTSIGDSAFSYCTGLTNITIPNSVTSIGSRAFYYCTGLTNITIPNSVMSIGYQAFYECTGLTGVTIPNSVTSIGGYAFSYCTGLTSITIPNSVTSIGEYAFYGCSILKDVYYTGTEEQWNKITIGLDNEYLTCATIHFNPPDSGDEPNATADGMRIIANNTTLAYYKGDTIILAVSNLENGVESCPERLSVKVSDSDIISVSSIYTYSSLPSVLPKIDEFKNCRLIVIKANKCGSAAVSITNSETGENRVILFVISSDDIETIRVNKCTKKEYKCGYVTDYYYGCNEGIWTADLEYTSTAGGYYFSMNCYNENYCNAVVEVFDSKGKIINVEQIDKFEQLTKSIYNTIKAGYIVVSDLATGDYLSFRSDSTAKCTKISNLFVPQDGFIRITKDVSVSGTCAVINAFDYIFSAYSLVKDGSDLITGIKGYSAQEVKDKMAKVTLDTLKKLILSEEYLKISEKFQKKIINKATKSFTPDMINGLFSNLMVDCDDLLKDAGLSLDGLVKTAFGTGVGIAEGVLEKCMGPYGYVLQGMFLIQDVCDIVYEVCDLAKGIKGGTKFGFASPAKGSPCGVLQGQDVSVDTKGNVPNDTFLETFKILKGDTYLIETTTGELLNDYVLYEIALISDGKEVQPNGKVTVYIDSPYEEAVVARINSNGKYELILSSRMENGMVVFDVEHFCEFVIFEAKNDSVNSVSINNIELNYKSSAKLNPVIKADSGVKYTTEYKSSNPKVATVDENGNVYGVNCGNTIITCTVTDEYGNVVSDTCLVTVNSVPSSNNVTLSMALVSETDSNVTIAINLENGGFNAIDGQIYYSEKYRLDRISSSSKLSDFLTENYDDSDCRTNKNNGRFAFASSPIYDITGNFLLYKFTKLSKDKVLANDFSLVITNCDTVNGIITPAVINRINTNSGSVKSVSINNIEMNYKSSAKLNPVINADNGVDYTIEYKSSNTKVVSVDKNGNVYGGKKGNATITCTVTDEFGNSVSDTCTVNVKYSGLQWVIVILLFGWIWY